MLARHSLLLFLLAFVVPGCGMTAEEPFIPDENEEPVQVDFTDLKQCEPGSYYQVWESPAGQRVELAIDVPKNYNADKAVPLVVVLHYGVVNFERFLGGLVIQQLIKPAMPDLNAIYVGPNLINETWLDPTCESTVMELVNKITEIYNVDPDRIMVVGYGIGAAGAWQYANQHPEIFQGCVAISGKIPSDAASLQTKAPMIVVHSKEDELFAFQDTLTATRNHTSAGATNVDLIAVPGISHYEIGDFIEPTHRALEKLNSLWQTPPKNAAQPDSEEN